MPADTELLSSDKNSSGTPNAPALAQGPSPIRLTWELHSRASLEATWDALSDTDRMNRAIHLGFRFQELPQSDGTTRREGILPRLGMRLPFEDLPFVYTAPEWFKKERIFRRGPILRMVTLVRLKTLEQGTAIRYTLELTPRNLLWRPIVMLEAHWKTQPQLTLILQKLVRLSEGEAVEGFDPPPPTLDREREQRLKTGLARVRPEATARLLGGLILSAPLREQDRMMPLRLARLWKLEEGAVIETFLRAAEAGVVALKWDVICPSCRMPKARLESLAELPDSVHCPSCNLKFDGSLPDALEVSFRPSPAIRDFQVDVACLGSPARQAHILAQDRLEPGAARAIQLNLTAGAYRIRTWPPKEFASIEVRGSGSLETQPISVGPFDLQPSRQVLAPGQRTLHIKNVTDRAVDVILEDLKRPKDLLTAGRLLEHPRARELIPGGALPPGFEYTLFRGAVLVVEMLKGAPAIVDALEQLVMGSSPRRMKRSGQRLIATFGSSEQGLAVASLLSGRQDMRAALSYGVMLEPPRPAVPAMGALAEEAIACLRGAPPGAVLVPDSVSDEPELQRAFARAVISLGAADYQLPGVPAAHQLVRA